MADDLLQAIELVKAGKKPDGGRILAALVKANPDNEQAWQWLSVCVATEEQKRHCLKQVLRINPRNEYAKKMLESLDFQPVFEAPAQSQKPIVPTPPITTQSKLCPFCKSSIHPNATVCPHCGKNVTTADALSRLGCSLMQLGILIPILLLIGFCLWVLLTTK